MHSLFLRRFFCLFLAMQAMCSASANTIKLNTLSLKEFLQQSGQPRINQSFSGRPLKVAGQVYSSGIGTRANSVWVLDLAGKATALTGSVGADDNSKGSLQFVVEGDGKMLWMSEAHTKGHPPEEMLVNLKNIQQMKLWILAKGDSDNSEADLVNPVIEYDDTAPRPIATSWAKNIAPKQAFWSFAPLPPMGWNTYQAFGASVTEEEVMKNAVYMVKNLLPYGWNTLIIDYRWSDADAAKHDRNGNGGPLVADSFGRLLPAPNRFPSAAHGDGFKSLAAKIHALGLKFGIHVMRGIPRQSVSQNTPIEGSPFHASDAANTKSTCAWCGDMWGIDGTKPAGQAYYDSIFRLYASWGVDFVKVDDISYPYSADEIACVREAIDKTGRPMVLSLSCGETPVSQANHVVRNANMWRVSSDFWDLWKDLNHSFDLAATWQGAGGPGHWPDFDMIPFGHLGIRCFDGESSPKDRWTRFNSDEQHTLLSLWCLEASPLILGGNLPDLDNATLGLLTNKEAIAIDQDSLGKPAACVVTYTSGASIWLRELNDGSKAVGFFNRNDNPESISVSWKDLNISGTYKVYDIWEKRDLGICDGFQKIVIPAHGCKFLKLQLIE